MTIWLRGIAAIVLGAFIGGAVNMGIIISGGDLVPPPAGVDTTDMESLVANMDRFEFRHFVVPWLAHALGTLVGAAIASVVAARHGMRFALGIGAFFMLGGVTNAFLLPAPAWFIAVDLLLAYLPMGWLGGTLALRMLGKGGEERTAQP